MPGEIREITRSGTRPRVFGTGTQVVRRPRDRLAEIARRYTRRPARSPDTPVPPLKRTEGE